MSLSFSAVRTMLRPIRPKPLIPTLIGIISSGAGCSVRRQIERNSAAGRTENAMSSVAKSQRSPACATSRPFGPCAGGPCLRIAIHFHPGPASRVRCLLLWGVFRPFLSLFLLLLLRRGKTLKGFRKLLIYLLPDIIQIQHLLLQKHAPG